MKVRNCTVLKVLYISTGRVEKWPVCSYSRTMVVSLLDCGHNDADKVHSAAIVNSVRDRA